MKEEAGETGLFRATPPSGAGERLKAPAPATISGSSHRVYGMGGHGRMVQGTREAIPLPELGRGGG